jgi:hypothetical protein
MWVTSGLQPRQMILTVKFASWFMQIFVDFVIYTLSLYWREQEYYMPVYASAGSYWNLLFQNVGYLLCPKPEQCYAKNLRLIIHPSPPNLQTHIWDLEVVFQSWIPAIAEGSHVSPLGYMHDSILPKINQVISRYINLHKLWFIYVSHDATPESFLPARLQLLEGCLQI